MEIWLKHGDCQRLWKLFRYIQIAVLLPQSSLKLRCITIIYSRVCGYAYSLINTKEVWSEKVFVFCKSSSTSFVLLSILFFFFLFFLFNDVPWTRIKKKPISLSTRSTVYSICTHIQLPIYQTFLQHMFLMCSMISTLFLTFYYR